MNSVAHQVQPEAIRFETHDASACRDYFEAAAGPHAFDVARNPNSMNFVHGEWPIGRISLHLVEVDCGDPFTVRKCAAAPYYQFNFLLDGACEIESRHGCAEAGPGDVFVLHPDDLAIERWRDHMLQLLVRVDRNLMEQAVATELGRTLKSRLQFELVGRDPGIAAWLRHIVFNVTGPRAGSPLSGPRVLRRIEDLLIGMILSGLRHSETEDLMRLSSSVAPFYVKRAEDFIRASARDDLSIEDVAAAAGVSPRTVFYGFKRWRGTTPMAYLRDTRLDLARKELESIRSAGGSISQAALNAGFSNFSQFSRVYKARFGETPSATLLSH